MERKLTRILLLVFTFCCLAAVGAFAQTVVIGTIDPGPYGQGSTIAVPFHLNTTAACASSTNVFSLLLSDANGNFGAPQTLIGTYAGFYGTFVNGIIPNNATAGSNYRIQIQCSDPAILPVASGTFTISASPGVTAGTSSQAINTANPEVFGACIGADNVSYAFVNASSAGATASASFFNELSQTNEGAINFPAAPFVAKAANYTIVVRASSGGIVGTKAYSLINNAVNNSFGASGSNQVCLDGQTKLTYSVDINSPNGIQKNYPGLIYSVTWGDGLSTNYTLCEIMANGGTIEHTYKKASCGNVANGLQNVFQIDLQPTSPFCGKLGTPVTGYARVIEAPKNKIGYAETACTDVPVVFANQSIPGQDPNSGTFDCTNQNALYTWVVDGVTVAVNYPLDKPLEYTFTTNGVHFVGLHLQNGNAICDVADKIISICIQKPPKPSFTLANSTICTSGPVTPVNTSVVDETCDANTAYHWLVTGPAQPTYLAGTTANSKTPTFNFTVAGLYTLTLDITTNSCGLVASEPQEVVINLNPTASLAPNSLVCGKDQVLTFGPNATTTKTTLTGTAKALPDTYTWTITGGAFSYENGTTANSQYPQVKFTEYKAYTINVVHQNNCNVASDTQVLTFQQSPDVNAGGDRAICEGSSTFMNASITGTFNSFRWIGGTGTFSPNRNTRQPTYTPSAAEILAGTATISLEVTTSLAAPCNVITNAAVISITRNDNITSAGTAEVCTGSTFSYTITSQNPLSTYTWTASVFSGTATGFGATGSGNTINDLINDSGTGDAVIKYTITPTTNGCPGISKDLFLTVNKIPALTATPAALPICSNEATGVVLTPTQPNTTYTWTSVADAGINGNTQQSTPIAAATITDLLANTGTVYGVVKYIITPYHGACAGQPVPVTVTIAPAPIASVAGTNEDICAGPTYTLKGNDPSPGTGKWTLASAQTGITFSDATNPNAIVSGLQPGGVYQFTWSINTAAGCTPTTSTVTITVDVPTIGGTVDGSVPVCADANHGFLNLTGNVGNVLNWESSTDGVNWITQLNTTNQYEYTNLIQTTQFRAVVQNGVCNIERSAIATVTVNQPVIAANGGTPLTTLCNAVTYTLNGNDPAPFTGIWTQTGGPPATFVDATNPKTVVNGLIGGYTYKFLWTIKGTAPCGDSQNEITIVNNPDVLPKFTSDFTNTLCGPVTVNFSNQSLPNFAGTTYLWDFGDGSGNTNDISPQHIFQPSADGQDITYKVTLTIINNCVVHEPFTMNITVRPAAPVATILPEKLSACGSLAIRLKNTSPGNNQYYDFFVFDGKTQVLTMRKTDKSDAVFAPLGPPHNADFYTVYVVATDFCGNTTQSSPSIPINIYPATFVPLFFAKDNRTADCFPLTVAFENISSGGATFLYRIYDAAAGGNKVDEIQGSKTEQPYTFNAPGTYYVSIVAINDCATFESTNRIKFEAYPKPAPNFTPDIASGCKAIRVSFANTTPANGATPAQSLNYEWDFGDGSAHFFGYTPIPHVYSPKNSPFTVTLKVTNLSTGCTDVIVKPDLIKVTAASNVDFIANPGFITKIPNYHFAFDDKTSGNPNPVSWDWDFGDGSTSAQQNPGHTYSDTGTYKVTLRVINRDGCDSTVSHNVQITGIPGQLYIPNAFMPAGSTTELRTFVMKGSGIESWRFQIFNNWGQLVWETTKLNSTGEPTESWDGMYKGVPAQQGVYVWQASAKFINGTEWKGMQYGSGTLPKRSGVIHLIR